MEDEEKSDVSLFDEYGELKGGKDKEMKIDPAALRKQMDLKNK